MQFDDVLDSIGGFGRYQKWVLLLVCVFDVFGGFIFLNPVFLLGIPAHRCALPGYTNDTYEVQDKHHAELISAHIPMSEDDPKVYDKCYTYTPTTNSNLSSQNTNNMTRFQCNKWVYDRSVYLETFVSKMDLVCDNKILAANAGMVFYLGMLVGSLVGGVISDRFGRKKAFVGSFCVTIGSSVANAWASSYAMFVVMQFLKGGSGIAAYMAAFIILMELIGKESRYLAGSIPGAAYVVGLCVFSGVAYCLRHWFWIQLVSGLPGVLFLSYWWLFPESPRWLLTRNKVVEAEKEIFKAAKWNRVKLPEGLMTGLVNVSDTKGKGGSGVPALFSTKSMCCRSLLIFFHWLVCSFVYYGLALNTGSLSGNLYLNFALLSLVGLPAYAIVILLLDRIGRRKLYFLSMLIAGLACLSILLTVHFAPDMGVLTVVLALVGKLGNNAGFAVIYVYSTELFPTVARNAGMGSASLCARVGSTVAPYLVVFGNSIGGSVGKALPFVLFGGASVLSACLVFFLPETAKKNLPENVQEGIEIGHTKSGVV